MKKILTFMLIIIPLMAKAEISEKDIFWHDPQAKKHKTEIVDMLNKLAQSHERCKQYIGLSSFGLSKSRSTPKNPDFFIQCGEGAPEVVHFTLEDMKNNRAPGMTVAATQTEAVEACRASVRSKASNPGSIDFTVLGANYIDSHNGNASLTTTFTAQSKLGVQEKFKVTCIFNGKNLKEATIKLSNE